MKIKHAVATSIAASLLMLTAAGPGLADQDTQREARLIRAGNLLSFGAIVSMIKQTRPRAVITEVDLDDEAGIYIYEVEVVGPTGVELNVDYDAKTGAFLSQRRGD